VSTPDGYHPSSKRSQFLRTASTSSAELDYAERSKTCGRCWMFVFGAYVFTSSIVQHRISTSFLSTQHGTTFSIILQEHSIKADGSKGPRSTSATPPTTNNTNDALPGRTLTSPSGTVASSSSNGGTKVAATDSSANTSTIAANNNPQRKCANCGAHVTKLCIACAEGVEQLISTGILLQRKMSQGTLDKHPSDPMQICHRSPATLPNRSSRATCFLH